MKLFIVILLSFYLGFGSANLRRAWRPVMELGPLRASVAILWHLVVGPLWYFAHLTRIRFIQPIAIWAETPIRWALRAQ